MLPNSAARRIAVVVKGYPRLSETFIAQELLALEARGLELEIWSLRHPTERAVHPMNKKIKARVTYLPEYLYEEPIRVLKGAFWCLGQKGFGKTISAFWRDLKRDFSANRIRRLGQAFAMARELPEEVGHIHVHYLHTPASVVRYTALLTGRTWTFSAHAKDIWTTPDWEKREKMQEALWGVTCTAHGAENLQALSSPERVSLVYHGLDLSRFPTPPENRSVRNGSNPMDPVRIVSVGRAVAKKGYSDLLQALAALPQDLHWRFAHIGGGELLSSLKSQAQQAGIADKVIFLGSKAQPDIIALLREADIFVLPSKKASSGDRDGLPNVIMEAASQSLPIIATDFAGIPEFIRDKVEGELVAPGDWEALSNALNLLARDPEQRKALGDAAYLRLRHDFSMDGGIDLLESRLRTMTQTNAKQPEPV
ncbi:glycosyltransferase family 4 protein [Microvirga sp. P5_D2]